MKDKEPWMNFKLFQFNKEWMEGMEDLYWKYKANPPEEEIKELIKKLNEKFGNLNK